MNHPRTAILLTAMLVCTCNVALGAGTPEATLEELVLTDQVDVVIQHLPSSMSETLKNLPAREKEEVAAELLISRKLQKEGLTVTKASVDEWQVVDSKGGVKVHIRLKNSFVSGLDAMVVLEGTVEREGQEQHKSALALISMQLQEGEWRITNIGGGEQRKIEDLLGHLVPGPDENELSAIGTLHTLNTAIITYKKTYPQTGLPSNLQALCENGEPSAGHAALIDNAFAATPAVSHGYAFHYAATGTGTYTITARPLEYGKTGNRNFFIDESGAVRATSEDREATAGDAKL